MKYTTFKTLNPLFITVFFILAISALSGCATKADPYKEELSAELYFQKAHEASDAGEFGTAIDYYKAYQQKFPKEIKGNLWASFEIAFIYHRQGNNEEALKFFQAILDKYDSPDAESYPQAPKILTEKVLAGIKNAMKNVFSSTPAPTPVTEPEKAP
jgi:outer membrane protein assembly factor BamD (BamD/ComL family)